MLGVRINNHPNWGYRKIEILKACELGGNFILLLLDRPKLYTILAFLSAIGLKIKGT